MSNLKHSKYKNTGMIFEFLTKQITNDVINDRPSRALKIMETYFNKNTVLAKELSYYKILIETKFQSKEEARELITKVITERKKISENDLKREKYNLVKSIKKNYDINEVFKRSIQNYKEYASIFKLFEYSDSDNIPQYIENKNTLLEHISTLKSPLPYNSIPELKDEDLETKILTYDIMVEKFNTKYSSFLPSQKTILKTYLDNFDSKVKLTEEMKPIITSTINNINSLNLKVEDEIVKIKVDEVKRLLIDSKNKKFLEENHIIAIMKSQELIEELKKSKRVS